MSAFQELFSTFITVINIPPYSMIICLFSYSLLFYMAPSVSLRMALLLYLTYAILDPTPRSPIKPPLIEKIQPYCNRIWFFRLTAKYFSCKLHKTYDLSPGKSYIFAYHPHGVIGMGCSMGLATDASNFRQVFPGIRRSGVTLNVCFWIPFFRDWMMFNGFCSANKSTLTSRLANKESLVLVPGGASEALHAHPKQMKFTILHRKGFIKLALETKSSLVPVIGFGENDVFDTVYMGNEKPSSTSTSTEVPSTKNASTIWKVQTALKQICSFSMPIWTHLVPHKRPINVVVGKPLEFDNSSQTVDQCHSLYLDALRQLYETHKASYGYQDVPLELV